VPTAVHRTPANTRYLAAKVEHAEHTLDLGHDGGPVSVSRS
jgi:GTP cyclohydrolase II